MAVRIIEAALLLLAATRSESLASEAGETVGGRWRTEQSEPACNPATAVAVDEVDLDARGFSPACVLVEKGQELLFSNVGSEPHTVSSDPGSPTQSTWLESGVIPPESSFPYTFYERGVFGVHCRFHPGEHAIIIVE